jgi:hypothetical protein
MKSVRILSLVVLFALNAVAQSDPWAPVRVFEGKWEGSVTGKPGKQLSSREYQFVSDGTFLWQHDHSVYEPSPPMRLPRFARILAISVMTNFSRRLCGGNSTARALSTTTGWTR